MTDIFLRDEHMGSVLSVEEIPYVTSLRVAMRVPAIWVTREALVVFAREVLEVYA